MACAQCHVNNNYTTLPTDCYGCHKADYTGTNNPEPRVSRASRPPARPATTPRSWTTATFNHNKTAFPLTGAHINVACAQCHVNNNYTTLPTNCYGCHQADFTGTTIRITCHPASQPIARSATPPLPGRRQSSITHRSSRSPALTPPCLRAMPHQQRLHDSAHELLRLPPGRLQHKSQSRRRGIPDHLRHVPHHSDWTTVNFNHTRTPTMR